MTENSQKSSGITGSITLHAWVSLYPDYHRGHAPKVISTRPSLRDSPERPEPPLPSAAAVWMLRKLLPSGAEKQRARLKLIEFSTNLPD